MQRWLTLIKCCLQCPAYRLCKVTQLFSQLHLPAQQCKVAMPHQIAPCRLLDVRFQLRTAFQHLRDLGSSLFTLVLAQNWLTVFSIVLTVISCSFYTYFSARGQAEHMGKTSASHHRTMNCLG